MGSQITIPDSQLGAEDVVDRRSNRLATEERLGLPDILKILKDESNIAVVTDAEHLNNAWRITFYNPSDDYRYRVFINDSTGELRDDPDRIRRYRTK